MKRIVLLGYILFLLYGYTYSQKPVDPRYYPGVLINGIYWSEYNVDAPGTFTTAPEAHGMCYQWNSKIGLPKTGDMSDGWLKPSFVKCWENDNNPCPNGWRIPTEEDIYSSFDDKTNVSFEQTQWNGMPGGKFTDKTTGKSIFFPLAGIRIDTGMINIGTNGHYWTSCRPKEHPLSATYNILVVNGRDRKSVV